jgi:hypothetical protein
MAQVKAASQLPAPKSKPDAFHFLVQHAEKHPQIVAIYAINANGVIDLWTVIDSEFDGAEEILAEIDVTLLQQFPHVEFDFMTVYQGEEQPVEIQLQNSRLIYSKTNHEGKNDNAQRFATPQ